MIKVESPSYKFMSTLAVGGRRLSLSLSSLIQVQREHFREFYSLFYPVKDISCITSKFCHQWAHWFGFLSRYCCCHRNGPPSITCISTCHIALLHKPISGSHMSSRLWSWWTVPPSFKQAVGILSSITLTSTSSTPLWPIMRSKIFVFSNFQLTLELPKYCS